MSDLRVHTEFGLTLDVSGPYPAGFAIDIYGPRRGHLTTVMMTAEQIAQLREVLLRVVSR